MRKERVIVYLYEDEVKMLDHVCQRASETRSELLRRLFKNYLETINVIKGRIHGGKTLSDRA